MIEKNYHGDVHLFASGREALLQFFLALQAQPGDEIIVQGYTCVVVPNAIEAAGLTPVFVDIDPDTLNLTLDTVRAAITPKTRAVICQHTFGLPADLENLRALCDEKKILLIEDCAHVIPEFPASDDITQFGDAVMFSFGRDKAVSGVLGGAMIVRNTDISQRMHEAATQMHDLPLLTIKRALLYPLIYAIARPLYPSGIGKVFLVLCRKLGLLLPIVTSQEKAGSMPTHIHHIPDACALLALRQLHWVAHYNNHRRILTEYYMKQTTKRGWLENSEHHPMIPGLIDNTLPLQKFPVFVRNADGVRAQLKKRNIHLDDGWTGCVICPPSVDLSATSYVPGSDPAGEALCQKILSLPTHPGTSMAQAEYVMQELDAALATVYPS